MSQRHLKHTTIFTHTMPLAQIHLHLVSSHQDHRSGSENPIKIQVLAWSLAPVICKCGTQQMTLYFLPARRISVKYYFLWNNTIITCGNRQIFWKFLNWKAVTCLVTGRSVSAMFLLLSETAWWDLEEKKNKNLSSIIYIYAFGKYFYPKCISLHSGNTRGGIN